MLNVFKRNTCEKTKSVLSRDYIPAVIYGSTLDNSIPVEVHKTEFQRFREAKKHIGVVKLNLNGEIFECTIEDGQVDTILERFIHIDFMLVK